MPPLAARGLAKHYGDFRAVNAVDLSLVPGEILALLGENGAGKSTLLKMLAGLEQPSRGELLIGGVPNAWRSRAEARRWGVGFVPQHVSVIPALTVRENVWMALPRGARARDADHALRAYAPELAPDRLAAELSLGERQAIEFVRVLATGARILLLDEPTSVLSPPETARLFARLSELRAAGKSIVLVTHKIADVIQAADRVVVMRAGRVAGEFFPPFVPEELVTAVVGSPLAPRESPHRPAVPPKKDRPVLRWRGQLRPGVPHARLLLYPGETLALVGVDGNGQRELTESLLGIGAKPEEFEAVAPMAYIPQDRHREGLVLAWALRENLRIGHEAAFRAVEAQTTALLERFDVRPAAPGVAAAALSGGNQQKLIVAREFGLTPPAWVLAFHPSHGLDFKATAQLHEQLRLAAAAGAGVLLITMDLDEALALGTRFGVVYRGRLLIDDTYRPDRERLGRLMLGENA